MNEKKSCMNEKSYEFVMIIFIKLQYFQGIRVKMYIIFCLTLENVFSTSAWMH